MTTHMKIAKHQFLAWLNANEPEKSQRHTRAWLRLRDAASLTTAEVVEVDKITAAARALWCESAVNIFEGKA